MFGSQENYQINIFENGTWYILARLGEMMRILSQDQVMKTHVAP